LSGYRTNVWLHTKIEVEAFAFEEEVADGAAHEIKTYRCAAADVFEGVQRLGRRGRQPYLEAAGELVSQAMVVQVMLYRLYG
jgi:hypothetical protein